MAKKTNFEHNLKTLEDLVAKLEGDMPLEKAIQTYEHGMKLVHACEAELSQLKLRVETLLKENSKSKRGS